MLSDQTRKEDIDLIKGLSNDWQADTSSSSPSTSFSSDVCFTKSGMRISSVARATGETSVNKPFLIIYSSQTAFAAA